MKHRNWGSKVLAIVCSFVLLASSIGLQTFAGAEEETASLKKLTFSNFGLEDETYPAISGVYDNGASLVNSKFSGYLTLNQDLTSAGAAAWMVLGTSGGWEGIQFQFQKNGTEVWVNTGSVTDTNGYNYVFDAANITSLNSFAGEKFKFTLSLEAADLDNGGTENDVLVKFYVNDELCVANKTWADSANGTYGADGSYYILNAKADKLNGYMTWQQIGGAGCCSDVAVESCTLTKIPFSAFGLVDDTYTSLNGVYSNGASLIDSEISGYFTLNQDLTSAGVAAWMVFGTSGGWEGIQFQFQKNGTEVWVNTGSVTDTNGYNYVFDAANIVSLNSFAGERFKFTLSLEAADLDNGGTENDVLVKFYVNDELCVANKTWADSANGTYGADGSYYILNAKTDKLNGYLKSQQIGGTSQCSNIVIENLSQNPEGGEGGGNQEPSTLPPLTGYTAMTFTHFGYEEVTEVRAGELSKTASNETLHNVLVDGYYNITKGGNYIYFGGAWKGIRLFVDDAGNMQIIHVYHNGTSDVVYEMGSITRSETGFDLHGREDLRIQTAFTFSNVREETTDVTMIVRLDEVYEETFTVSNVPQDTLLRTLFVWSLNANCPITLTSVETTIKPSGEFKDITPADFGFTVDKVTGTTFGAYKGVSLDGTRFTTDITFPKIPSSQTRAYLRFGGADADGWTGFGIETSVTEGVEMMFVDWGDANPQLIDIDSTVAGTSFYDTSVKLTITTEFADADGDQVEDDVVLSIYFNDNLYDEPFVLLNRANAFGRNLLVHTDSADYPVLLGYEHEEGPDDSEEVVKPELKTVTLAQLGITNGIYKYNNGDLVATGSYDNTLMNTVITTKLRFSEQEDYHIRFAGKQSKWHGIVIQVKDSGLINILAADGEFSGLYQLTSDVAGTAFTGTEIELSIELFEDVNKPEDAMLGIYINGVLYNNQYFRLAGARDNLGNYVSFYVSDPKGSVQIGTPEPAPTVDESFTQITFDSYEIETGRYSYDEKGLAASGHNGLDSLDRVVFSDIIQFSETEGAELRLGGDETPWYGLLFRSTGNGKITLYDTREKFAPVTFDSAAAGVDLLGQDVEWTLSFEYVDFDEDGLKDDVKLGVWFDGVAYNGRWIYLKDCAPNLGGYLGIYCPNESTYVSLVTYLVPIDFKIWGFSLRWAYELGLKKA